MEKKIIIKKDKYGFYGEKEGVVWISSFLSNGYSGWNTISYWKTLNGITKFIKKNRPEYKIVEDFEK